MRKLFIAIGITLAAGAACGEENLPMKLSVWDVPSNDTLAIRSGPNADETKIGEIPANGHDIVAGQPIENMNWLRVTYGSRTGFVSTRFLAYGDGMNPYALPVRLQCSGTEPFWGIEIGYRRADMDFAYDETKASIVIGDPVTAMGQPNLHMLPGMGKDAVSFLLIEAEECSDGMSEKQYPYSLRARVGGGLLSGCCEKTIP